LRAFFSGELGSSIQNQRPVHKEIKRKRREMRVGARRAVGAKRRPVASATGLLSSRVMIFFD
jgi:hypothetical protein